MQIESAKYLPLLPLGAMLVCGLLGCIKPLRKLSALVTIAALAAAFALVCLLWQAVVAPQNNGLLAYPPTAANVAHGFQWISLANFESHFSFFIDSLTIIMLLVITGVGTLIAIYASGYMAGDPGYFRFFAYVALFIFAMMCVVMADNLLILYLGWEGVGLASYLLIGFYYKKPSAVAAAKKAFIVNRIGDLGFALGIMLTWYQFGTIEYVELFRQIAALQTGGGEMDVAVTIIPFLLMLGAIGKSAQLPLYVWLPDAMEGPTPVSALIHAATMVTSGVYMIARLLPLFELSSYALPTVAIIGAATALFGATIAVAQTDIKRIWAYSTVSQLGYMFLGVGVASSTAGVFHLVSHAFFKALLFLTAGSVMHALAGQLDLHKMSGLIRKMPITAVLMLCGALSLAGFPFTSGFFSKDMIIAEAWIYHPVLGVMGLLTAAFTAFYAFRLWFRVFLGPTQYQMGEEHHGAEESNGHAEPAAHAGHASGTNGNGKPEIQVLRHHEAHEMPWLMNAPLVLLAIGALGFGLWGKFWIPDMISGSTARWNEEAGHHYLLGLDLHLAMEIISSCIAVAGIALAAYFHWLRRSAAERVTAQCSGLVKLLANKYYVDEIYDALIVRPLRTLGQIFFIIDDWIINGLVSLAGLLPRLLGQAIRPAQTGLLQSYAVGMAAGVAVIVLLVVWAMR